MARNSPTDMALTGVLALSALSWTALGLFGWNVFDALGPEMTGALAVGIGGVGVYDAAQTFGLIEDC